MPVRARPARKAQCPLDRLGHRIGVKCRIVDDQSRPGDGIDVHLADAAKRRNNRPKSLGILPSRQPNAQPSGDRSMKDRYAPRRHQEPISRTDNGKHTTKSL
jgi:hypothetical protein